MRNEGRDWEHPALTAARQALALARRKSTEEDRLPPSLFPMTRAASAAKGMYKRQGKVQP